MAIISFIIIYALTLLYICTIERFRHFALIVGLQGWLLLVLAYMQLGESSLGERIFVITETLVFKGLLVPYLLLRIIDKLKVSRVHHTSMPPMITVLVAVVLLAASLWITSLAVHSAVNPMFFGVALFGILVGLLLITVHRRIFSHLIGFLVIENSVFLFSLAIGAQIPMLINIGVLLDILMGVLMLGLFITKLGNSTAMLDSDELTKLRD